MIAGSKCDGFCCMVVTWMMILNGTISCGHFAFFFSKNHNEEWRSDLGKLKGVGLEMTMGHIYMPLPCGHPDQFSQKSLKPK